MFNCARKNLDWTKKSSVTFSSLWCRLINRASSVKIKIAGAIVELIIENLTKNSAEEEAIEISKQEKLEAEHITKYVRVRY